MQADLELLPQLLQAQGQPPWGPWESPDTSSNQEQGEQQKAEPWIDGEKVGKMRGGLEKNSSYSQALCFVSLTPQNH